MGVVVTTITDPFVAQVVQGIEDAAHENDYSVIESYIAELRAFIECLQQDRTLPVTGVDGCIPVIMGYVARKSYEEHRPVRLDEIAPV